VTATTKADGIGGIVAATKASSVAHIGPDALVGRSSVPGDVGGSGRPRSLTTVRRPAPATPARPGFGFSISVCAGEIEGGVTAEFDGTIAAAPGSRSPRTA
jgi:hypothetical protein